MQSLIPQCSGLLSLAHQMKAANVAEITAAAAQMVKNACESAIEEREQWKVAGQKVEQLVRVFGSNAQVMELRDYMAQAESLWNDCVRAYLGFLESVDLPH